MVSTFAFIINFVVSLVSDFGGHTLSFTNYYGTLLSLLLSEKLLLVLPTSQFSFSGLVDITMSEDQIHSSMSPFHH